MPVSFYNSNFTIPYSVTIETDKFTRLYAPLDILNSRLLITILKQSFFTVITMTCIIVIGTKPS